MANTHMVSTRSTTRMVAAPTIAALLAATLAIASCGSGSTATVSVQSHAAQSPSASTGASSLATAKPTSPAGTSGTRQTRSASNTSTGTATAPQRTASSPAFTRQEGDGEGLSAALQVLRGHGFSAGEPSEYRSGQTLRVLIGTRREPGGGYVQQAFFFEDGRYLGTDTSQPSASVEVAGQSDTEVTLSYSLYRPHDPPCCPGGGRASVRFELNNGSLQALDAIPPVSSSSAPSRQ